MGPIATAVTQSGDGWRVDEWSLGERLCTAMFRGGYEGGPAEAGITEYTRMRSAEAMRQAGIRPMVRVQE